MLLYAATVSLSAFLLFALQPIIAKMILPWFGGSSTVWSTCMLFFQAVLLLGYLYAHWLHRKLAPRLQSGVHIALLAASLAALPVLPNPAWKTAAGNPSLRILALLGVTVGLPYFLLSSTSPLIQAWYAQEHKDARPYRLFALSNFASMLALLSYPLLVEPNLSSHVQGVVWSAAYGLFAAVCAAVSWRWNLRRSAPAAAAESITGPAPLWTARLLWFGLSAGASILLLAVTNYLTQDVAAVPFLWILPLSVYLLSFILCFESPRYYRRDVFLPPAAAGLAFMAYRLWPGHAHMNIRPLIDLLTVALLVCCMSCHGELARLKPHPRFLTGFYVTVSLGGAAGGLFVGLIAPNIFDAYYEFPLGLGLCAVVLLLALARDLRRLARFRRYAAAAASLGLAGAYLWWLGAIVTSMVKDYRVVARNFYGELRVYDKGDPADDPDAARALLHGAINHGEQMLRPESRRTPITYFCPDSGIGRTMRSLEGAPRRIGILGLGCGTLAAYGRAGDTIRIYEINPLVLRIARTEFTFLQDTPAKVEVALGDGRLQLDSEPSRQFDLLVMDAFSGDSVPVHLITREAFRTYFRHLKPNGILAINITNAYLDLEPVIERAAADFGKQAYVFRDDPGDDDALCFLNAWAVVLSPTSAQARPEWLEAARRVPPHPRFREWTDDFSNMYGILK